MLFASLILYIEHCSALSTIKIYGIYSRINLLDTLPIYYIDDSALHIIVAAQQARSFI